MTLSKTNSQLTKQDTPHIWEVKIPNHPNGVKQMHCGNRKDADRLLEIYPDATISKVYLPPTPDTVDVPHFKVGEEQVLPMQQILPQSELQELDL